MLDILDRGETARGGAPYWSSHYKQFGLSSDFLHDPFLGVGVFRVDEEAGLTHVDLSPDVRWDSWHCAGARITSSCV